MNFLTVDLDPQAWSDLVRYPSRQFKNLLCKGPGKLREVVLHRHGHPGLERHRPERVVRPEIQYGKGVVVVEYNAIGAVEDHVNGVCALALRAAQGEPDAVVDILEVRARELATAILEHEILSVIWHDGGDKLWCMGNCGDLQCVQRMLRASTGEFLCIYTKVCSCAESRWYRSVSSSG